ncbi:ankyrin repeat domain-containing protein [Candidatus Phycorickettsia trachydisci]|nr:ankyrin repeat domain-containing protein [Candidatus Phycorickettsia trachydisci]
MKAIWEEDSQSVIQDLLNQEENLSLKIPLTNRNLLHFATQSGKSKSVDNLLNLGFKKVINDFDAEGNAPLHYATKFGDVCMLQSLIEAGADVNVRDAKGRLPLHYALKLGKVQSAQLLINWESYLNDKGALNLISFAVEQNLSNIICLLILRGAYIDLSNVEVYEYLKENFDTLSVQTDHLIDKIYLNLKVANSFFKVGLLEAYEFGDELVEKAYEGLVNFASILNAVDNKDYKYKFAHLFKDEMLLQQFWEKAEGLSFIIDTYHSIEEIQIAIIALLNRDKTLIKTLQDTQKDMFSKTIDGIKSPSISMLHDLDGPKELLNDLLEPSDQIALYVSQFILDKPESVEVMGDNISD